MEHAIRMWSAVSLEALYLQFGKGARLHLCMDEWNCPTPVGRRLSLTQTVRGKLIPTGLALVLGIKLWSLEVCSQYTVFHLWFFHSEAPMPSPARLFKRFRAADTNSVWILISFGEHLRTHLKDHARHDQGPKIHGKPRIESFPVGNAQLAGCLKVWVMVRWSEMQASIDYAQGVV